MSMKRLLLRAVAALALLLTAAPVFAQEAPDAGSAGTALSNQADDGSGSTSDQGAPTPGPQVDVDTQAVIAQWGPAPEMGHDADQAIARRWLRDQQAYRDRWGIPGVSRDPYLDWEASNALHDFLGEPLDPPPAGLAKPEAALQSPESNQQVRQHESYWPVPDDLWQAWRDSQENKVPAGWAEAFPNQPYFSRETYLKAQVWRGTPFDRFRLFGVAGRVNVTNSPVPLMPFHQETLERLAPGSVEAYQPVNYQDSLVAVVAYDPWMNPNGSLRQ